MVDWALKENPLGQKRTQDKSQKKKEGKVGELMHREAWISGRKSEPTQQCHLASFVREEGGVIW